MFHCFNDELECLMFHEINRFRSSLGPHPAHCWCCFSEPWQERWGERARGWCCIFVKIDCSPGDLQLTWKSSPPSEPDCVGSQNTNNSSEPTLSSHLAPPLSTQHTHWSELKLSFDSAKFYQRKSNYIIDHWDCQGNRLSFQPWDLNNLFSNDNSFKMKFTVGINLIPHQA